VQFVGASSSLTQSPWARPASHSLFEHECSFPPFVRVSVILTSGAGLSLHGKKQLGLSGHTFAASTSMEEPLKASDSVLLFLSPTAQYITLCAGNLVSL
jgi:hypothetical protein